MNDSNTRYFATLDGDELAVALGLKIDRYQAFVRDTGLYALWAKAYQTQHGMGVDGFNSHEVRRKGKQGQYSALVLNHFRNLVTHYLTLATAQRMAMEPQASNTDWKSEMQVRIARGVLDFYMRAHLEQSLLDAVEYAALLGEGWVSQGWNFMLGEATLPGVEGEDGQEETMRTGDLESWALMPMDVIRDPGFKSPHLPWMITRRYRSKWDVVAEYPEQREKILAVKAGKRETETSLENLYLQPASMRNPESDLIAVYEFWHARTPAVPEGRHALFLNDDTLLWADTLVYQEIPVRRVAPDTISGTSFGYTPAWDLLAPQEAVNALESIALTNYRAHGVGIIIAPKGSDVTPQHVSTGLAFVKYTPGLPEPKLLSFMQPQDGIHNGSNRLVGQMETIIGVNSVVRGNPEASLKSGSALALVQAQAVQFASKFQGNIVRFQEKVGKDTVLIFQLFATEPIRFEVVGEDGVQDVKAFTGEDIAMVGGVKVDAGNPLAKTLAGRVQVAENLVNLKLITDPMQYIRVLETGNLEPMTAAESRQRSLVKEENERLARVDFLKDEFGRPMPELDEMTGRPKLDGRGRAQLALDRSQMPIALVTDNPHLHVQEHMAVLSSTRARRNPAFRRAVLEHIREHHDVYWEATLKNPGMLELMNIQPMQAALAWAQAQAMPAGAPAGAPGAPAQPPGGGDGAPQEEGQPAPQQDVTAMPGESPPDEANLPKMPRLPPGAAQTKGVNPMAPGPGPGGP